MGFDFFLQHSFFIFIVFIFIVYWIFIFVIFYHLTRFGIGTQPKKFATIFLVGSVILFFISTSFFMNIDTNLLKNKYKMFIEQNKIIQPI